MKSLTNLMLVLLLSLLGHYFVLNFFTSQETEIFSGVVERIQTTKNGIYSRSEIKLKVETVENGQKKEIVKNISVLSDKVNHFLKGQQYTFKTHNNWLVSFR